MIDLLLFWSLAEKSTFGLTIVIITPLIPTPPIFRMMVEPTLCIQIAEDAPTLSMTCPDPTLRGISNQKEMGLRL